MIPGIFLHGGGDRQDQRAATFGRFLRAALAPEERPLALIVAEEEPDQAEGSFQAYRTIFESLHPGVDVRPIFAGIEKPVALQALAAMQPGGVFVCGGSTPFYHRAVCADRGWLAYLREHHIPYGGTSAGAAIAAESAILGGWRSLSGREMLFVGAGEGLEQLTVQPGLGLVPFSVEVHASQMGTLTRLIHAVESGLVESGWAIDENTLLQVAGPEIRVWGAGQAYHVSRDPARKVELEMRVSDD